MNLLYETAIGCGRDALVVNVGANKGYVLAELVSIFAPQAGIGPIRLGEAYEEFGLTLNHFTGCGVCADCREDPAPSSAVMCVAAAGGGGGSVGGALLAQLTLHAFEPMPDNIHLLRSVVEPLLAIADGVSLKVHAAAVVSDAARVKSVPFQNCKRGEEACSISSAAGSNTVDVPTASLDLWAERELKGGAVIDLLFVDAEGYDPDVIRGASALLRSGRVRILEFEYHGVNLWEIQSLDGVVTALDWQGYSCFLIGRASNAVLLTGCFEPASMEKKAWSNVLCVRRSENATLAALMAMTAIGGGAYIS